MIGASSFVAIGLMIAFGVILPLTLSAVWIVKKKEKVTTLLLGGATWFVFAILLESIPRTIFFTPLLPVGKAVLENAVLYVIFGALMAGIFEETGRFVVFKTLLRKQKNKEAGISHGIGHGGFEAFYLMAFAGVQNLVFAVMINTGAFGALIDQVAGQGEAAVAAMEAIPAQIAALTPASSCLSLLERGSAILLHVGLSILLFFAVQRKKGWLYPLAILLHALFDLPAALYQTGHLNLYLTEACLAVYAVAFFLVVYFFLYRRDIPEAPVETVDGDGN